MNKDQYYDQINIALDFIRKNIDEKINLEEISNLAGLSSFHFQRIFSAFVGENLSSYIRRIKLEKAAFKLKYENFNIINIAYDAGYETPMHLLVHLNSIMEYLLLNTNKTITKNTAYKENRIITMI